MENQLVDFESKHSESFETVILKPGGVLGKTNPIPQVVYGVARAIRVNTLAGAMIDIALNGRKGKQTLENSDLEERGRAGS